MPRRKWETSHSYHLVPPTPLQLVHVCVCVYHFIGSGYLLEKDKLKLAGQRSSATFGPGGDK